MVEIDFGEVQSSTTVSRNCVFQFEFPVIFNDDIDDITNLMVNRLTKGHVDLKYNVIDSKDADIKYISIRPNIDRIEGSSFASVVNNYMNILPRKYKAYAKDSEDMSRLSKYVASEVVDAYDSKFIRIVSEDDPMETDVGFYGEDVKPEIIVEIKSNKEYDQERFKEILESEKSRFWRNRDPRYPILNVGQDEREESIFHDIRVTEGREGKNILLFAGSAASLQELSMAVESFKIGGSNRSDVGADSTTVTCSLVQDT
jgi:hypothetical protein